jgi:hypothetical protein
MDHSRYLAYRSVERSLRRTPEWLLSPAERERLRDVAEALLLTTEPDDAERLRRDAAFALALLVAQKRCDDAAADALWDEICDCGPRWSFEATRRVSAARFAGAL